MGRRRRRLRSEWPASEERGEPEGVALPAVCAEHVSVRDVLVLSCEEAVRKPVGAQARRASYFAGHGMPAGSAELSAAMADVWAARPLASAGGGGRKRAHDNAMRRRDLYGAGNSADS